MGRVAHMATVAAREAYILGYEHPDGAILRKANEFVHRVTGYIGHVLDGSEGEGQDASVMAMIEEYFQTLRLQRYLFGLAGDFGLGCNFGWCLSLKLAGVDKHGA